MAMHKQFYNYEMMPKKGVVITKIHEEYGFVSCNFLLCEVLRDGVN